MKKISGIYCIKNIIDGHKYIGQSNDIYMRWKSHWKQVRSGDTTYLHNAMRKYGESSFKLYIIEECPIDKLNEREIYWIKYYNTYNDGYNLTYGGEGVKGKKYSEEEKENLRKYNVKTKRSKPIYQIDDEGVIIKEWRSANEAAKELGISPTRIVSCLKYREGYIHAYGYIWMYKNEYDKNGIDLDLYLKRKQNSNTNRIFQIDKNNKIVQLWDSVSHILSLNENYTMSAIHCSCNGLHKTAYGYVWIYEKDYNQNEDYAERFKRKRNTKKVYQFDLNKNLIASFNSIVEASKETNIGMTTIGQCIRQELNTAGGYIWRSQDQVVIKNNIIIPYDLKRKYTRKSDTHIWMQNYLQELDKDGNIIKTFNTIKEASSLYNIDGSSISKVCRGKMSSIKGHFFKYAE